MKLLAVWLLVGVSAFAQSTSLTWETDYDRALDLAKVQKKPVLVYVFDAY